MKKLFHLITGVIFFTSSSVYAQNNFEQAMNICILLNDNITIVLVQYNTKTGDTTVIEGGVAKPFSKVYPMGKEYALLHPWYTKGEPILFNGRTYKKEGYPRIVGPNDIQKTGVFNGVNIYTEKDILDVIYLPVRQGCEFQPYFTTLTAAEYSAQGRKLATAKNYYHAIQQFNKCIALSADSTCYLLRAISHGLNQDKKASDSDFEKTFQLKKNHLQIYLSRGNLYMKTNNKEGAISDFRNVLKLDPTNAQAKAALAQLGVPSQ